MEIALRTRVGCNDLENLLGLQSIQCQLCLQQWQWTHQSARIKFLIGLNFHEAQFNKPHVKLPREMPAVTNNASIVPMKNKELFVLLPVLGLQLFRT